MTEVSDFSSWLDEVSSYIEEGHMARNFSQPLGPERDLQPTARKMLAPSVIQLQEIDSGNSWTSMETDSSAHELQIRTQPIRRLDCNLVKPWTEDATKLHSYSWPVEIVTLEICSLKSLTLWSICYITIENEYNF